MTTNLEQDNHESDAELKRCISRLSYIGMGLSEELDDALARLRNIIKTGASEQQIKQSIDNISKILRTLEDKSNTSKVEVLTNEVDLVQLLLQQKLPPKLKLELKKISNKKVEADANEIAGQIVSAIQSFFNELEHEPAEVDKKKPSFLSKIFNRTAEQETRADELTSIQPEVQGRAIITIPDELKASLQYLVDQLSAMDTYSEVALKLTDKVSQLNSVKELAEILELIAGAFVEVAGYEHQQFEGFLKSLAKRIDRVNDFIGHTASYSEQVKNESGELESELKISVSSIKSSVESSSSLDEVKTNIYQKMDSILERMNNFYQTQEMSHQKLAKSVIHLKEQLKATEDESSRLRDDLAEQKVRAQTDPLTKLPNRYSYNERLTQEYNRWRRYRSPLSLVIGDIDFFKKVNDEYGHDAGDAILKKVGHFLQYGLRESDFIARFGGEEFVILLPETTLVDATKVINKLRLGIKNTVVEFEQHKIQVAISFGISAFEDNDTPKVVFSRADKALYRAKERGRDQVCCQRAPKDE